MYSTLSKWVWYYSNTNSIQTGPTMFLMFVMFAKTNKQVFLFMSKWGWNSQLTFALFLVSPDMTIGSIYPYLNRGITNQSFMWRTFIVGQPCYWLFGSVHCRSRGEHQTANRVGVVLQPMLNCWWWFSSIFRTLLYEHSRLSFDTWKGSWTLDMCLGLKFKKMLASLLRSNERGKEWEGERQRERKSVWI